MKITEITASVGRTIQFQQYEPVNIHVSLKAEVECDPESVPGKALQLEQMAQNIVNKDVEDLIEKRAVIDEERFSGEIHGLIKRIEACQTREEKIALWSETPPEIRRLESVKIAFKK